MKPALARHLANYLRLGIRQKMILVLVTVLAVALGVAGWFTLRQQEENILSETHRYGENLARVLSQSLAYGVVGYDYHSLQLQLDDITRSQDLGYARVLSAKGNVMAESGTAPDAGRSWTMFNRDIVFDQKVVGRLVLGLDNSSIIARLQDQRSSVLSREVLIILLIAVGEFLALSYVIVRPITIISRSLEQGGVDDTGMIIRQIPLQSDDELGRLAYQFNEMREQLNDANGRLQSRIELADAKLTENNQQLRAQAEELQRMNQELQRIAITDSLTGLCNRRYFEQVAETDLTLSMRHGDMNSIMIIDVDHFKAINDRHGHKSGDNVLVELGQLLAIHLRKSDLVCRMGGEEFLVLCRRTGQTDATLLAEKLRRLIELHPFQNRAGERIPVTVSAGIVTFPDGHGDRTIEDIVHLADLALYRSKECGRNCVTHCSQLPEAEPAPSQDLRH
jgi:diguanylate cyclase (GGDEF)-like protein